jgi:hypothetical protein
MPTLRTVRSSASGQEYLWLAAIDSVTLAHCASCAGSLTTGLLRAGRRSEVGRAQKSPTFARRSTRQCRVFQRHPRHTADNFPSFVLKLWDPRPDTQNAGPGPANLSAGLLSWRRRRTRIRPLWPVSVRLSSSRLSSPKSRPKPDRATRATVGLLALCGVGRPTHNNVCGVGRPAHNRVLDPRTTSG